MSVTAVIVAAEFNKPLVDVMVESATDELRKLEVDLAQVVRVPGSYELPLVAQRALSLAHVHVVVVLGYIERGETLHGEVMGHVVHQTLMQLELTHGKPVGLGIIGPGASPEQAALRKEGYARAAVRACLASLQALAALQGGPART